LGRYFTKFMEAVPTGGGQHHSILVEFVTRLNSSPMVQPPCS
jgi:hypothetical protein